MVNQTMRCGNPAAARCSLAEFHIIANQGQCMITTRWMILAGALAFVSLHGAQAEDKVRLRLNWMYYGSHAGFALGKDKGIYDKHGIDLDVRSGNGSGSANRLVANGDSMFGYASCAS